MRRFGSGFRVSPMSTVEGIIDAHVRRIVFDGAPAELAAADLERIYGEPTGPAPQAEDATEVPTPKTLETLVEEMEPC